MYVCMYVYTHIYIYTQRRSGGGLQCSDIGNHNQTPAKGRRVYVYVYAYVLYVYVLYAYIYAHINCMYASVFLRGWAHDL